MAGLRDELNPQINQIEEEARSLQSTYSPVPQYETPAEPLTPYAYDSGYRYDPQAPTGFQGGVVAGVEDIQGTANVLAAGVQNQMGYTDAAVDSMNTAGAYFQRAQGRLQNKSITDMNSLGDYTTAIAEQAGRMLPTLVTAISGGGAFGAAAQNLVKTMAKKGLEKQTRKAAVATGATLGSAIGEGGEYFSNMAIPGTPERNAWESRMGRNVEGDIATGVDGVAMSLGEQLGVNMLAATTSGALNLVPLVSAVKKLPNNKGVTGLIETIKRMGSTGLQESATESMQTMVEHIAANYINENRDIISDQNTEEIMTAAALAFPLGAITGGIGGGIQLTGKGIAAGADAISNIARQRQAQKNQQFLDQVKQYQDSMNTYQIPADQGMMASMDEYGYDPYQQDEMSQEELDAMNEYLGQIDALSPDIQETIDAGVAPRGVYDDFEAARAGADAQAEVSNRTLDKLFTDMTFDPEMLNNLPMKAHTDVVPALGDIETTSLRNETFNYETGQYEKSPTHHYVPMLTILQELQNRGDVTEESISNLAEFAYQRLYDNTQEGTAVRMQDEADNYQDSLQTQLDAMKEGDNYNLGGYRNTPGVGKLIRGNMSAETQTEIASLREKLGRYKPTGWQYKKAEARLAELTSGDATNTDAFNLKLFDLGVDENVAKIDELIKNETNEKTKKNLQDNVRKRELARKKYSNEQKLEYVAAVREGDADTLVQLKETNRKDNSIFPQKEVSELGLKAKLAADRKATAQDAMAKAEDAGQIMPTFDEMGGVLGILENTLIKMPKAGMDGDVGTITLSENELRRGKYPVVKQQGVKKNGQPVPPTEFQIPGEDPNGNPVYINIASLGQRTLSRYSKEKMTGLDENFDADTRRSIELGLGALVTQFGYRIAGIPADRRFSAKDDRTWGELVKSSDSKGEFFKHNVGSNIGMGMADRNEFRDTRKENEMDITDPSRPITEEDTIVYHPEKGLTSARWEGDKLLQSKRDEVDYEETAPKTIDELRDFVQPVGNIQEPVGMGTGRVRKEFPELRKVKPESREATMRRIAKQIRKGGTPQEMAVLRAQYKALTRTTADSIEQKQVQAEAKQVKTYLQQNMVRRAGRVYNTAIEVKTRSVKSKTKANYETDYAAITDSKRIQAAMDKMQQTANGILNNLGVPVPVKVVDYRSLPKAAVAANREGRLHGLIFRPSADSYAIYVNPMLDTSEAYRVFAHELGHIITKLAFAYAPESTQKNIIRDWQEWVLEYGGDLEALVDNDMQPLRSLAEVKAKAESRLDKYREDQPKTDEIPRVINSKKGKSLASYNKDKNVIFVNNEALLKDYENDLAYIRGKGKGKTSGQKKVVFGEVDVNKLKQWFDRNGGFDAYKRFVLYHEMGHRLYKHSYKTAEGAKLDVMSQEAIAMEKEANQYAFDNLKIAKEAIARNYGMKAELVGKKGQALGGVEFQHYHMMFDEYMAERVAYWLLTDAKPQTVIQKFFSKLAAAVRTLWNFADKPTKSVETWLNTLWKDNSQFTKQQMDEFNAIRNAAHELPEKRAWARKSKAEKDELLAASKPLVEKIKRLEAEANPDNYKNTLSAKTHNRIVGKVKAYTERLKSDASWLIFSAKELEESMNVNELTAERNQQIFDKTIRNIRKLDNAVYDIIQDEYNKYGVDMDPRLYSFMMKSKSQEALARSMLHNLRNTQNWRQHLKMLSDTWRGEAERINAQINTISNDLTRFLASHEPKAVEELKAKEQAIVEARDQLARKTKEIENKYRLARKKAAAAKDVKEIDTMRRQALVEELGAAEYERISGKKVGKKSKPRATTQQTVEAIDDLGLTVDEVMAVGAITSNYFSTRIMGFIQVFNTVLNEEERGIILKAADSFYIRRQLLAGMPEQFHHVIETDPEMAAAYMFDMYRAGMLDIGKNTESLFHKIIQWVAEILGIVSNSERAVSIFDFILNENDARRNARMTDPAITIAAPKQLTDTMIQRGFKTMRPSIEYIGSQMGKIFAPTNMRFSKNPYIQQILRMVWTDPLRKYKDPSFREGQDASLARLSLDLQEAIGEDVLLDGDLQRQLLFHMQNGSESADPTVKAAQVALRKWFDSIGGYAKSRGVDLKYLKDYFPQVWDADAVMADRENFIKLLEKNMPDTFFEEYKKKMKLGKKDITKGEYAEKIADAIIGNEGGAEIDFQDDMSLKNPYMNAFHERSLKWAGEGAARRAFAPYLSQNLQHTLGNYTKQVVRRAEYVKVFGENGVNMETLLKQAEDSGATAREIRETRDFMDGVLGLTASNFVKKHPKWAKAIQVMSVFQALRTLSTGAFANMADIGGLFMRGQWRGGLWAMGAGMQEDYYKFAEQIGAVERALAAEIIAAGYDTHGLTGKSAKVADWFFKANGMQALTRMTRAMGTALANRAFYEWSQDPVAHADEILEMGLKVEDLQFTFADADKTDPILKVMSPSHEAVYFRLLNDPEISAAKKREIQAKLDANDRKVTAVNRFVNSTMLRPDAASRPNWSNNPLYHLLFQLKGFMYKFWDVYHRKVFNDLMYSNKFNSIVPLLLFAPLFLMAEGLRDLVQHLGEGDPRKDKWGFSDHLDDSMTRGGVYGPFELVHNFADDLEYHNIPGESLAGPSVEWALDWGRVALGQRSFDKQLERSLPGQNLYMPMIRALQNDE